jgi:DNA polymerase III subunit gamma/tau
MGAADVAEMLGTISNEYLYQFLEGLADNNAPLLIQTVSDLAEKAPDFSAVLGELIELLHQVALAQVVPDALDRTEDEKARLSDFAERFHREDLQLFYQIAMQGRRDMPVAPDPRSALEMILLRMLAFAPVLDEEADAPMQVQKPSIPKPEISPDHGRLPDTPAVTEPKAGVQAQPAVNTSAESDSEAPQPDTSPKDISALNDWVSVVPELGLAGMARELANNCMYQSADDSNIHLGISKAKENMVTDNSRAKLEAALSQYLGKKIMLQINPTEEEGVTPAANQLAEKENRQKAAEQSIMEDDFIREMQEAFDAEPVPGTVKPN